MKKIALCLALALAASSAVAQGFFHHNKALELSIRGDETPCRLGLPVNVWLAIRNAGIDLSALKHADVVYQGQAIEACWAPMDDGKVFIVDETGDAGVIQIGVAI
jgi:hypothetical protein